MSIRKVSKQATPRTIQKINNRIKKFLIRLGVVDRKNQLVTDNITYEIIDGKARHVGLTLYVDGFFSKYHVFTPSGKYHGLVIRFTEKTNGGIANFMNNWFSLMSEPADMEEPQADTQSLVNLPMKITTTERGPTEHRRRCFPVSEGNTLDINVLNQDGIPAIFKVEFK